VYKDKSFELLLNPPAAVQLPEAALKSGSGEPNRKKK
jgi:ribosomal protein L11